MKKNVILVLLTGIICAVNVSAQEALKSTEEEYYNFLALQGIIEKPALNYRTLSDSVWNIPENTPHPWENQNLGTTRQLFGKFQLKVYGPELFSSINTAAPYGHNDGALWQGKGFNASFTNGIRVEGYGIELTFKPQLAFSQNAAFDIMQSAYDSEYGYFWGYSHKTGVDAPQRFGNKPFFTYDWGDSEIRYTWKTLTAGFGTQAIWLGPAYLNPMLHSNNAPAYPKFDIGIRRQRVTIPGIKWYAGDIETRLWVGYLSESDYFDKDASNDHNMFHGLSFAYAPSFLPGLMLSANRVCTASWKVRNLKYIIPDFGNGDEDQKASFAMSWLFPQAGLEVFGEFGIDDFVPGGTLGYIRHPFHTTVYSFGLKKTVKIKPIKNIYGGIIFESNWMEMTQDYQYDHPYSFYFHNIITQGYTNRGQWLGNGLGTGGNSQYLAFKIYYPQGYSQIFISRNNPDNNYLYKDTTGKFNTPAWDAIMQKNLNSNKANFLIGLYSGYFLKKSLLLSGGLIYDLIINPFYEPATLGHDITHNKHNFAIQMGLKWTI
ncbi:hypothetical protein FACS1894140_6770 [Spirochaetia bacterium]|nr:hypothetical protein FACS1894140_6770 [Spirochaetia bacterium]